MMKWDLILNFPISWPNPWKKHEKSRASLHWGMWNNRKLNFNSKLPQNDATQQKYRTLCQLTHKFAISDSFFALSFHSKLREQTISANNVCQRFTFDYLCSCVQYMCCLRDTHMAYDVDAHYNCQTFWHVCWNMIDPHELIMFVNKTLFEVEIYKSNEHIFILTIDKLNHDYTIALQLVNYN